MTCGRKSNDTHFNTSYYLKNGVSRLVVAEEVMCRLRNKAVHIVSHHSSWDLLCVVLRPVF